MHVARILREGARPHITGFTASALKAASKKPKYDPWERYETWRHEGKFSRWNRFNSAFPGLGIATVAFGAYCGYEYMFQADDHHHGHEGHAEGTDAASGR